MFYFNKGYKSAANQMVLRSERVHGVKPPWSSDCGIKTVTLPEYQYIHQPGTSPHPGISRVFVGISLLNHWLVIAFSFLSFSLPLRSADQADIDPLITGRGLIFPAWLTLG